MRLSPGAFVVPGHAVEPDRFPGFALPGVLIGGEAELLHLALQQAGSLLKPQRAREPRQNGVAIGRSCAKCLRLNSRARAENERADSR